MGGARIAPAGPRARVDKRPSEEAQSVTVGTDGDRVDGVSDREGPGLAGLVISPTAGSRLSAAITRSPSFSLNSFESSRRTFDAGMSTMRAV